MAKFTKDEYWKLLTRTVDLVNKPIDTLRGLAATSGNKDGGSPSKADIKGELAGIYNNRGLLVQAILNHEFDDDLYEFDD